MYNVGGAYQSLVFFQNKEEHHGPFSVTLESSALAQSIVCIVLAFFREPSLFLNLQGILFLYCKVNLIEEIKYRLFFVKQNYCANIDYYYVTRLLGKLISKLIARSQKKNHEEHCQTNVAASSSCNAMQYSRYTSDNGSGQEVKRNLQLVQVFWKAEFESVNHDTFHRKDIFCCCILEYQLQC